MSTAGEPQKPPDAKQVLEFLRDHFVHDEPILSSLNIENISELDTLLTDIIKDCLSCACSNVIKDQETEELIGVCLASRTTIFDEQMDRLCKYTFNDKQLQIAVEFLKYVFNRVDIAYHIDQHGVGKPIFIALIAVRKDRQKQGIATSMLQKCLTTAKTESFDGALILSNSVRASRLMKKHFGELIARIKYRDFKGEFKDPPIIPAKPDEELRILLKKL
ncbi:hypothetical protein WR25_23145 [Diploscapter pachys]|uniref:N-acetyltransferase domain-containing protein n=1 Tax=Diploscapter pachys TaxID=2018661 RepID=A0A2A2LZR1_9BILA|nr:hypothetical protein WR25_23145 [Diploscapter pachys]